MKTILLVLLMILTIMTNAGCATSPKYRSEWAIDTTDKASYDEFMAQYETCKDFAYRSKVAGSKYSEADIHTSCLQRKGYSFKYVRID